MKTKTPSQVNDQSSKTSRDVLNHIQAITDDVRNILSGGLSMFDKQLPFQTRSVFVTSGQPNYLTIQAPYTTVGCIPIQTNGAVINSFSSSLNNGQFSITVNMNVSTAQIVFLMIGSNV
jgi:hypothetical protein